MTLAQNQIRSHPIEMGLQGAAVECLPSSAKAVFSLLGDGKARTLNEIIGRVAFSPRTIRNALHKLRNHGLIVAKFNFKDARKPLYQIKTI